MRVSSDAPALSRRSIFRGMAAALIGASVAGCAASPVTANEVTAKPKALVPDFDKEWNVYRYIGFMRMHGEHCHSFYRGERLVAYNGWFPELVGSGEAGKHREYIAALKELGRTFQVPEGVSMNNFMDRLYRRGARHEA